MRTQAGIVLQARYASTRLRGKALEPIGGRTMLEQCLRRLIRAGVARVVLATTCQPEDDALALLASRMGVPVFRGETDDVLRRVSEAARAFDLDPVIRATADNPAVDVQAPGRVLAALRERQADYVREDDLPYGTDVEGMTAAALHRAAQLATDPSDREHVTTFIRRRRDLFRVTHISAPAPLHCPSLRLTVDTAEDLAWVRELYFRARSDDPTLLSLIAASGVRRAPLYAQPTVPGSGFPVPGSCSGLGVRGSGFEVPGSGFGNLEPPTSNLEREHEPGTRNPERGTAFITDGADLR